MHSLQGICPLEISQNSTPRLKISDLFPCLYDLSLNDKGSLYAAVPSPIDEDIICPDRPKSVIFAIPDLIRMLEEDCK